MNTVQDKVIIVTGASAGIGLATAKLLAQHGAKVALAARSADVLNKLTEELPGSFAVPTDMTKESDIKEMIQKVHQHFGKIDVLVNNAEQGLYAAIADVDIEAYMSIIQLNVIGPLVAMQQVIPIMKEQGEGHILNISSLVSKNYFPMLGAYASTKYALNALSLTARTELEGDNIIVNVMHPGLTATEFGKNSHKSETAVQDMSERFKGMPEADTAEYIAERILLAIETGDAEVMAH
ncbi:MAG: SDR family oxidoreductase [Candidatus Paceibacterota bacterium]